MSKILIGEKYLSRLDKPLKAAGFTPIPVPDNPYVDKRLSGHVDLSVCKVNEKTLIVSQYLLEYAYFVNELTNVVKLIAAHNKQMPNYPHDANLCSCICGDHLIHHSKCIDPEIVKYARKHLIDVRQGYSNCMVCAVSNNAIITSDRGIADAAGKAGIGVLQISPGHIELEGFNTGFIGGASFSHEGSVYFTGTLTEHPDRDKISRFIAAHGSSAIYLTAAPIFDIGGAVVL